MKAFGSYLEKTYAGVLFELANEYGLFAAVKDDLDSWTKLCSEEKDFEKLIVSPYFSSEYKQQLVRRVLSGRVGTLTLNFLMTAIRHNRPRFLPGIIQEYDKLWHEKEGYCSVDVTVAGYFTDDQKQKFLDNIVAAMNKKVKLHITVNPEIIGGVIIRYEHKVIDNSIRTRLQNAVQTIIERGKAKKIDEV